MKLKYSVQSVSSNDAELFCADSPHTTVFTQPTVLSTLAYKVDWWCCQYGDERICMWPVTLNDVGIVFRAPFSYWVGPIWSRNSQAIATHRRLVIETEVYEALIRVLIERYGTIRSSLAPGITDVRVFDWWNYHAHEESRFRIFPRYTAQIEKLQERQNIRADFRELRRRQIRKMERVMCLEKTDDCDGLEVSKLYDITLFNQNVASDEKTRLAIENCLDLVRRGFGRFVGFRDCRSKELISILVMLCGNGVANMVINVAHPHWRQQGIIPLTVFSAIQIASELGYDTFDFNGANSPRRGDDKHSYGAKAVLYFDIELN